MSILAVVIPSWVVVKTFGVGGGDGDTKIVFTVVEHNAHHSSWGPCGV